MILLGKRGWGPRQARHLVSDTSTEELLAAAAEVGLQSAYLQVSDGGLIHFDVFGRPLRLLLEAGVLEVPEREIAERGLRV